MPVAPAAPIEPPPGLYRSLDLAGRAALRWRKDVALAASALIAASESAPADAAVRP